MHENILRAAHKEVAKICLLMNFFWGGYIELEVFGGRGEIRTHGGLAPTTVFKTVALNRSATLPSKFACLQMKA